MPTDDTVQIEWLANAPMKDADGEPLKRGDTGPLDEKRAQRLQAMRFCTILDGGDPDLADLTDSAEEPPDDTPDDMEAFDGTD